MMWLLGSDKTDEERARKSYQTLVANKLIKNNIYTIHGNKISRDIITQKGMNLLCCSVDKNDPIKALENTKVSVRAKLNTNDLFRVIRRADSQFFLSAIGIDTVYTAITEKRENPFVFGDPQLTDGGDATYKPLSNVIINQLVDHVNQSGNKLPFCFQCDDTILFLPNSCNPLSMAKEDKRDMRTFNNSVGVLIDFVNKNAYMVFKAQNRKELIWIKKAYLSFSGRMSTYFKKWKMENINNLGYLEDAIILCETKGEMMAKAHLFKDISEPFEHVYPILMKRDGLEQLSSVLDYGIVQFRNLQVQDIQRRFPALERLPSPTKYFNLRYQNRYVYIGTLLDFGFFHYLANIENENCPYVICYEWQREYYKDVVQVPNDLIVVLDDFDGNS